MNSLVLIYTTVNNNPLEYMNRCMYICILCNKQTILKMINYLLLYVLLLLLKYYLNVLHTFRKLARCQPDIAPPERLSSIYLFNAILKILQNYKITLMTPQKI